MMCGEYRIAKQRLLKMSGVSGVAMDTSGVKLA
jgi:hypothetical protein